MSWKHYLAFDVRGVPKGQPRHRSFATQVEKISKKTGKLEKVWTARAYDPGTAEGWKSMIALAAIQAFKEPPVLDCPIRLGLTFYFPRPKYLMRKKDPDGPILHTAKPDSDNSKKAVMDALTQVGMWRDDALVCSWFGDKFYAGKGKASGVRIEIQIWEEEG